MGPVKSFDQLERIVMIAVDNSTDSLSVGAGGRVKERGVVRPFSGVV